MSINGIGQNYYQNNTATNKYNGSKAGQFYSRKQSAEESAPQSTRQNACVQDIYETLKSRVSNEYVKELDSITDIRMNMLVSEAVQARFPLQKVDAEGNPKEEIYFIAVDKDGIRCSKPGENHYEWEILFTDESQYKMVTDFLNYAREYMDNFLFAAHKNFWEDYLDGTINVDDFKEFLKGTNNGMPDYSFTKGDSMYIDKEKAKWAQYMNPLGAKFYTAEYQAEARK